MKLIVTFILLFAVAGFSGTLGDFSNITNRPGRITPNSKDPHYLGALYTNAKEEPKDGIDRRTPSRILLETYIEKNGRVNLAELEQLLVRSKLAAEAAFQVVCQKEKKVSGAEYCQRSLSDFEADSSSQSQAIVKKYREEGLTKARLWADSEVRRAMELAKTLPLLSGEQSLNSPQAYEFYEALFNSLDVYSSAQLEDPVFGSMFKSIGLAKNILTDQLVQGKVEAANLVHPQSGQFLGPSELSNFDPSELDPPDSGFWRRPTAPISQFNTSNYNGQVEAENLLNPDVPVDVTYHNAKGGGTRPKMRVRIGDSIFKLKLRMEIPRPGDVGNFRDALTNYSRGSGETQTETVVNNLAAALGFTVDPTFYKRTTRLFFDDGFRHGEDRAAYQIRFNRARAAAIQELQEDGVTGYDSSAKKKAVLYDYEKALSTVKTLEAGPQAGRQYVELTETSLEQRADDESEISVGGFGKALLGRSLKREIRGFQIFYAWINDDDAKDGNGELKLIKVRGKNGTHEYKPILSASDMGSSLGWLLGKNSPNIFSKGLVNFEKSDKDKGVIALKQRFYSRFDIWDAVTFNDARWMVRLIAQLTPDQIRTAFQSAGYPEYVTEVFTQKLLNRRDELLIATGLMGTTVPRHGTREPVTLKAESELKEGVVYKVPGYEDCFDEQGNIIEVVGRCDQRWTDSIGPVKEGSREQELIDSLLHGMVPKLAEPYVRKLQRFDFMYPLSSSTTTVNPENAGSFFEGVAVGVDSFIPARYIIENPILNSSDQSDLKPYWIVDVFRTGYGVSRAKELDARFHAAGFDLTPADTNFDVRVGKTWEFIRIRAVRDPKEFTKGITKVFAPKNMFITAMKDLSEKLVLEMLPGDVLISSSYVTPGFSVRFTPVWSATTLISPSLKIGASQSVTKRITLVRGEREQVLANWQDLLKSDLGGNVSLNLFVFKLAGLKQRLTKLSQGDRLFEFNLADENERRILLSHLKRSLPELEDPKDQNLLKSLAVSDKDKTQKESIRTMGVLGFPRSSNYKRAQEVVVRDPQSAQIQERFLSYKKGKNATGLFWFKAKFLNSNRISSEAVADKEGRIFARFEIDYERGWAKRSDFIKASKNLLPLLPSSFVQFDPKQVGYYCGTLDIEGEIFYSSDALSDIFGKNLSKRDACKTFVASMAPSVPEIDDLCATAVDNINPVELAKRLGRTHADESRIRSALLATRYFTENFISAQSAYLESRGVDALSDSGKGKIEKAMKRIVALLETRPLRNHVLRTLQSLTSNSRLYREAKVTSSLSCLPNQEDELKLNKLDRGTYTRSDLEIAETIFDYTDTKVDNVHNAIERFFYDFLYKNSVVDIEETQR